MPSFALTVVGCYGVSVTIIPGRVIETFRCTNYYIPLNLGPLYFDGANVFPYGGSTSGSGSSSGSTQPNPNITCNSPTIVVETEVGRLYMNARNQYFNSHPTNLERISWLDSNQLFSVSWSNGGYGDYFINDSTFVSSTQVGSLSSSVGVNEESCY